MPAHRRHVERAAEQSTSHHTSTNLVRSPSLKSPSSCAGFGKGYELLIWWKTRGCTGTVHIEARGLASQSPSVAVQHTASARSAASRLPGCASLVPALCQHYTEHRRLTPGSPLPPPAQSAPFSLLKHICKWVFPLVHLEVYIVPFCLSQAIQITRQLSVQSVCTKKAVFTATYKNEANGSLSVFSK